MRCSWLLVAFVLVGWRAVVAQEGAKERARALVEQAQAAYDAGRYAEAASAFEEANRLYPHPNNLYNAAKAWEAASEYDKAIKAYQGYLRLHVEQIGSAAPDAANVERTIELLREKAFLALPEVTIDSDPPGADISVDDPDRVLGQTPFTTHLPEGVHRVFLKKAGYEDFSKEFVVRSREPLRLTFALQKVQNVGGLRFHVNIRKARIYVDGKVQAVTPYDDVLPVEAGAHQVLIEKDRYNQVARTVQVETGQIEDVYADLYLTNPPFSWRGYVGIASGVVGTALVVTSVVFFRKQADKYFQGTSEFNRFKTLTYTGYGVGGALIGAGAGLLVWEFVRKDVESEDLIGGQTPAVMIGVEEGGVFVGATGRF